MSVEQIQAWEHLLSSVGFPSLVSALVGAVVLWISKKNRDESRTEQQKQSSAITSIENKTNVALKQNDRIEEVAATAVRKADEVKEIVNGPLGVALKATAAATAALAESTKTPKAFREALRAEILSDEHDANAAQTIKDLESDRKPKLQASVDPVPVTVVNAAPVKVTETKDK